MVNLHVDSVADIVCDTDTGSQAKPAIGRGIGMNVLIIDDERTILKTVYAQLTKMELGMERIDIADSAMQARECMNRCHYDIFLCDIVMPGEDGITFA